MAQSIAKKPRMAKLGAELFPPGGCSSNLDPRAEAGNLGKAGVPTLRATLGGGAVLKPFGQLKPPLVAHVSFSRQRKVATQRNVPRPS